jgi:hypothetical protein
MKKKKNSLMIFLRLVCYFFYYIFKTVFIDLFVNLKFAFIFAFNPVEKERIKRNLETEKMIKLMNERIKILERIVYAMNEDAGYLRSDRGKFDLKSLEREIK